MMLMHSIKHLFGIKTKKEQAINLRWKYFNSYDPLCYNKQKGTSNKFAPEIFLFLRSQYFTDISSKP